MCRVTITVSINGNENIQSGIRGEPNQVNVPKVGWQFETNNLSRFHTSESFSVPCTKDYLPPNTLFNFTEIGNNVFYHTDFASLVSSCLSPHQYYRVFWGGDGSSSFHYHLPHLFFEKTHSHFLNDEIPKRRKSDVIRERKPKDR